jgi:hypothetical protein
MFPRESRPLIVFVVTPLSANRVWAKGFRLGEMSIMTLKGLTMATVVAALLPLQATAQQPAPAAGKAIAIEVVLAEASEAGVLAKQDVDKQVDITADGIKQLEKAGMLTSWVQIQIASLEGKPAFVQFGETAPVATSQSVAGFRSREGNTVTTQHSMVNVGTIVKTTACVEDGGGILVNVDLERSRLVDQPPPGRNVESPHPAFVPSKTETITVQTTVRVPPGRTVVAATRQSPLPKTSWTWILVTAKLIDNP